MTIRGYEVNTINRDWILIIKNNNVRRGVSSIGSTKLRDFNMENGYDGYFALLNGHSTHKGDEVNYMFSSYIMK